MKRPPASPASEPPQVIKVAPPGWWAGHSLNPVRLLVRGKALHGASAAAEGGLRCGQVRVNSAGTAAFFDVRLPRAAAPGPRPLTLTTPRGSVKAPFEILRPVPRPKTVESFSPDDVLYLIMPDRFARGRDTPEQDPPPAFLDRAKPRSYHGGNLQGVLDRLDYLSGLGVTALWLTPLYANTAALHPPTSWSADPFTDYHGYGAIDYYALDERLGTWAQLRELVAQARRRGVKVILDMVNNHVGPHHPWTADPPTPSWFHGTPQNHRDNPFQTWVISDPYAAPGLRAGMSEGWFGGILPDLNQSDPEVARYLTQNILWWLGMSGADGLRHDVAGCVPRDFWRDCFRAVKKEYPAVHAVGEVNGDLPATIATYQAGRPFNGVDAGFDSLFDFPLRKAIRAVFLDGCSMEELPTTLSQDRLYADPDMLVTCLGLHDDPRFMGRPGASNPALKLAFTFVLTTRGIPLIYYGDEIAMPGGPDPDNRRDFPGGWAEDPRDAFTPRGRAPREADVFDRVSLLCRLRGAHEALRRGRLVNLAASERRYAYARVGRREAVVVLLNNGATSDAFDIPLAPVALPRRPLDLKDALGGPPARLKEGRLQVRLPAKTAALYFLKLRG